MCNFQCFYHPQISTFGRRFCIFFIAILLILFHSLLIVHRTNIYILQIVHSLNKKCSIWINIAMDLVIILLQNLAVLSLLYLRTSKIPSSLILFQPNLTNCNRYWVTLNLWVCTDKWLPPLRYCSFLLKFIVTYFEFSHFFNLWYLSGSFVTDIVLALIKQKITEVEKL